MPDTTPPISITTTADAVAVAGEIDAHTAPELAAALAAESGRDELVVDLSGVEFVDSSGLRALLEEHHTRTGDGRRLVLRRPSGVVLRLFEVAGVRDHFTVDTD